MSFIFLCEGRGFGVAAKSAVTFTWHSFTPFLSHCFPEALLLITDCSSCSTGWLTWKSLSSNDPSQLENHIMNLVASWYHIAKQIWPQEYISRSKWSFPISPFLNGGGSGNATLLPLADGYPQRVVENCQKGGRVEDFTGKTNMRGNASNILVSALHCFDCFTIITNNLREFFRKHP